MRWWMLTWTWQAIPPHTSSTDAAPCGRGVGVEGGATSQFAGTWRRQVLNVGVPGCP